jgi:hypothetical protein
MFILNTNFHFVEAVADVGRVHSSIRMAFASFGLNCDNRHSAMAIVRLQLLDALVMHLRDWAVIAGEYYDQHRTGRVIGETTDFPSTPGKEKSGAGEPKVRIGWVVCPQAAAASSNEKINRYIRFQPPSRCS